MKEPKNGCISKGEIRNDGVAGWGVAGWVIRFRLRQGSRGVGLLRGGE